MKTVTYFFLVAALAATTLLAQEPPPKPSPKPAAGKAGAAPEPKPEKGRATPLVNVRVDVKIIDERAGQPATTKVVSMTVADRQNGWFRSNAEEPGRPPDPIPPAFRQVPLNVDASPFVDGSRIRLTLGLEYNSIDLSAQAKPYPKLEIKQRLNLVLEDGKPMRVAQSADPVSDRRVSLEVTATILR
jgi:hypothetical protein